MGIILTSFSLKSLLCTPQVLAEVFFILLLGLPPRLVFNDTIRREQSKAEI
jgi:hypothetical protein